MKHFDVLGQEIKVGSIVLHSNMDYAGFGSPSPVQKLTEKRVSIRGRYIDPNNVVVIDKIMEPEICVST